MSEITKALIPINLPDWTKPDPNYNRFQLNKNEGAVAISDMAGHHCDIFKQNIDHIHKHRGIDSKCQQCEDKKKCRT